MVRPAAILPVSLTAPVIEKHHKIIPLLKLGDSVVPYVTLIRGGYLWGAIFPFSRSLHMAVAIAASASGCARTTFHEYDEAESFHGIVYYERAPFIVVYADGKGGLVSHLLIHQIRHKNLSLILMQCWPQTIRLIQRS